jgi:hypothetical protein
MLIFHDTLFIISILEKSMNSSCGSTIECKETFYCVNQRCMCVDLDYVNGDICSPSKLSFFHL